MSNKQANPYAKAAGTYGNHSQQHTNDPRELESRVLLKAAQNFVNLQNKWSEMTAEELDDTLAYNRQIWMMFVDTASADPSEERPRDLRSNIANLGTFIFKHSLDIIAAPKKEKLDVLIQINRDIAAGLMSRQKSAAAEAPATESAPESQKTSA